MNRAALGAGAIAVCLGSLMVSIVAAAEELTLPQAIEHAVRANPAAQAGRFSAEAARHAAAGARALPNPEITIAPTIAGEAGSDSELFVNQPLEINGSRRVRSLIASAEARVVALEADAAVREIVLDVSTSYWDVVQAQELVKLGEDNLGYVDAVRAAVQKQHDVGAVPGAQVLKMNVELARARQELQQAKLALVQSRSELNSLMGRDTATEFTVPESLSFDPAAPDADALRGSALSCRPEVAAAAARLEAAQGSTRAARLQRVPDLALQARRESLDSGSDGGVAIAVTLPLLDWGSGTSERRRAEAAVLAAEKEVEAERARVLLDVDQALQRASSAATIAREYSSGVLETSEELAAMARKGYERGANTYLEVLEAQRTLRATRSEYTSALAEHAKALARLEWATGCALIPGSAEVKK